ncbi:hypothetical protein PNEG_04331 [Pneumocystis murina B123]|uniref:Uncharacterized protein n=1 Tax=Pneumocystis murina (strain B123) TaxID=1069680 RepID=A0A0W4ZWW8_PNEMU|nr:hypothetical protein PNEG_04331 [Pneumocystis murina B123]KTW32855.1 hypothetical protein PNEG_04331 [Pneumocystis murina B123]
MTILKICYICIKYNDLKKLKFILNKTFLTIYRKCSLRVLRKNILITDYKINSYFKKCLNLFEIIDHITRILNY